MFLIGLPISMEYPVHAQDKEVELKQLLTQRRDSLDKLFNLLFDQIWIGGGEMTPVLQAQRDLLNANLELCSTHEQRIVVLQKATDKAAKLAKRWETEFTGNIIEVEQSKAASLQIRIELLREELKVKPTKPKNP